MLVPDMMSLAGLQRIRLNDRHDELGMFIRAEIDTYAFDVPVTQKNAQSLERIPHTSKSGFTDPPAMSLRRPKDGHLCIEMVCWAMYRVSQSLT